MKAINKNTILISVGALLLAMYTLTTKASTNNTKDLINKHLRGKGLRIIGNTHLIGTTNINTSSTLATNIGNAQNQTNINSKQINIGIQSPGTPGSTITITGTTANLCTGTGQQMIIGNGIIPVTTTGSFTINSLILEENQETPSTNIAIEANNTIIFGGNSVSINTNTIDIGASEETQINLYGSLSLPVINSQNNDGLLNIDDEGNIFLSNVGSLESPVFSALNLSDLPAASSFYDFINNLYSPLPTMTFIVQLPNYDGTSLTYSLTAENIISLMVALYPNMQNRHPQNLKSSVKMLDDSYNQVSKNLDFIVFKNKKNSRNLHYGFSTEKNIDESKSFDFATNLHENQQLAKLDHQSICIALFNELLQANQELLKNCDARQKKINGLKKTIKKIEAFLAEAAKNNM